MIFNHNRQVVLLEDEDPLDILEETKQTTEERLGAAKDNLDEIAAKVLESPNSCFTTNSSTTNPIHPDSVAELQFQQLQLLAKVSTAGIHHTLWLSAVSNLNPAWKRQLQDWLVYSLIDGLLELAMQNGCSRYSHDAIYKTPILPIFNASDAGFIVCALQVICHEMDLKQQPYEWVYDGLKPLLVDTIFGTRKGTHISLAALYCAVGRRLECPLLPSLASRSGKSLPDSNGLNLLNANL